MIEDRNQGTKEPGNQVGISLNPGILESSNPTFLNIGLLWRLTWQRTLLLTGVGLLLSLILRKWQIVAGVFAGSVLLLADIYALKAPLEMMVRNTAAGRRVWVFALGLLRIVVLGGILFVLAKCHVASIPGMFIGVTLPVLAMVSAVLIKPRATSRNEPTTEPQRNSTEATENGKLSFALCPLRFSESSVVVSSDKTEATGCRLGS